MTSQFLRKVLRGEILKTATQGGDVLKSFMFVLDNFDERAIQIMRT